MLAGAGAFGVQSAYSHQQADYYLTAGYTEYIELRIPTPTYVVMVEFGASRGMGAIVGVKAKSPDGEWVALYKGKARLNPSRPNPNPILIPTLALTLIPTPTLTLPPNPDSNPNSNSNPHPNQALVGDSVTYKALSSYWKWAPPNVCRTHFKATDFRVELDTSTETGIDDWNEYDYMKVYGSATLQPAVLPYGQNSVVYVPYKDAHGEDSFTYSASDCTGNLFRSSVPAKVSFTIAPVNDPGLPPAPPQPPPSLPPPLPPPPLSCGPGTSVNAATNQCEIPCDDSGRRMADEISDELSDEPPSARDEVSTYLKSHPHLDEATVQHLVSILEQRFGEPAFA